MPKIKLGNGTGCFYPKGGDLKPFNGKWFTNPDNTLGGIEIPSEHWESFCDWYEEKSEVWFELIEGEEPKKPAKPKVEPKSESIADLSDLISACIVEIKRAGISRDDAKKLTLQRYGKISKFMNEGELSDYLTHLKSLPTAICGYVAPGKKEALNRQTRKDFKVWQHRYTEEGLILLVKGYLWGKEDVALPANEDGTVNEPKFAELAIQCLEDNKSLPGYIQSVLENLKVAGQTVSYREYFKAQKMLKKQNELIGEIAQKEGKTKQQIGREMAQWAEKAGLPNHREKMSVQELESVSVYLTQFLNPSTYDYGDDPPESNYRGVGPLGV